MPGLWVWAETIEKTLELLSAGAGLAARMGCPLVAWHCGEGDRQRLIAAGADEVWTLQGLEPGQPVESFVPLLADEARLHDPDLILLGGSPRFKEIAARAASRLDTGLCSDCIGLSWEDGTRQLKMERMVYGGAGVQTVVGRSRPVMATVPPRTFEPAAAVEGRSGAVRELAGRGLPGVEVLERRPRPKETADITEARVIVCVGRGIEKPEDLALARELADLLGGQVACTRPIAEELDWLPEETYIGLSGKRVKPELYIGMGISGQIQHTTGIRDSKVIVAVNRDESAPIFEASDYGVVGDLYQVIPLLIEEIKAVSKG
ncbi:MAG: electron transfer flavoprotein subunit alpha/FixB family protein [Firmicutes bacterium]|nr:electron transfer flavoprotein subunit alpha/FixB family protein [Bacillota bacterium]